MPPAHTVAGVRRRRFCKLDAARIAARNEYIAEQEKPKSQRRSLREIGAIHGVPYQTLARLVAGGRTQAEYIAAKQTLTVAEEAVLETFLAERARRGFPLTNRAATEKAQSILLARGVTKPLGVLWIHRYLKRHPRLQKYRTTPLERTRANGLNPTAVREYFEVVEEIFAAHNPEPFQIYGMDEVGINLGLGGRLSVIGEVGKRVQHDQTEGERENVTVIETICGDGTYLKPTVIFKGKNLMQSWGDVNPDDAKWGFDWSAEGKD